jgi:parallel beta-helix repeat protein
VIDSCVFTNGVLGIMFETNTIYNITNNTFKNNKFINNSEYSIYCDEFKECENNTLENNEFINCTYYTVVFIGTGDSYFNHNDIKNNKFMNIYNLENSWNGCAIKVESTTIENMAITNNTINNCSDCGMYICEECIGTNNTISQNTISNCRDGISLETTGVHIYLNNLQNNRYAISPYSVSSNYPHSPIMTFAYNGKSYTGRLGNYYGEDLGDSNNGIYVKPQGGIGVVPR